MIILTGYQGFIGKEFTQTLWHQNLYRVEMGHCFEFLEQFQDWKRVHLIIHQGAMSSTVEKDINKIHRYNVDFSIKLFEKAIEYNIPVIYASSASVYGNKTDGSVNPLNYYAISKLQVDYWVQDNIDKFKKIQGFRYFNVYGDGEEHKGDQASPVSKFTWQIRKQGYLNLFEGSDNFLRDFVCVKDVVRLALYNNKPSGIYDLGTNHPVSFQYVAEQVAKKEGGEIRYVPFPDHLKGKYQDYTCANMSWIQEYPYITIPEYLQL